MTFSIKSINLKEEDMAKELKEKKVAKIAKKAS